MKYLKILFLSLFLTVFSYSQDMTGLSLSNVYGGFLHLSGNGGVTSSLQNIYDGKGGLTALQLSTLGIKSDGTLDVTGAVTFGSTLALTGDLTAPNVAYNDAWGQPKGGMLFDGVDDKVIVLDDPNLDFGTGNFTIAIYYRRTTINPDDVFISTRPDATGNVGFSSASANADELDLQLAVSSSIIIRAISNDYNDVINTDNMAVFSVDRNVGTSLYKNGNLKTLTTNIKDDGVNDVNLGAEWQIGAFNSGQFFPGYIHSIAIFNNALTQAEVSDLYNNGLVGAAVPYKYSGSPGDLVGTTYTAGGFVVNRAYRIVTVGTTDYTLIGASANTVGIEFVATGVGSGTGTALRIGNVLNIKPENFGSFGVLDSSPNRLNGNTSGSPVALSKGREVEYVDYKQAITGNTTLTDIAPAGYELTSILFEETAGNAVTGGVKVGTSSGGTQVVVAEAVGANADGLMTLATTFYSITADQDFFVQAITAWNSASINLTFRFRRVR